MQHKGEDMQNTTLVIMAAGIGSRFGGGIKQLTSFGPSGEIIMDYSIHDAMEAGFNKVVFVIRHSMLADFRSIIGDRIAEQIPVEYAFQEIDDLPDGCTVPAGRTKPWGTGQAILACQKVVKEPFAVINADDYYGRMHFAKYMIIWYSPAMQQEIGISSAWQDLFSKIPFPTTAELPAASVS
jgi:dTDP-glucose pyrophosphorylase